MKSQYVQQRVENEPPLPGVEFEELLSVGSARPGLSRRLTAAVLAVMAAVVCMGLGGRAILGAPESNRNADPIAVAAGRPAVQPEATPETNRHSLGSPPATSRPNPERLPLGFAIEALPTSPTGDIQRIAVVGFVGRQQNILLRVVEPDGTVVASTTVGSRVAARSPTAIPAMWAFEGVLAVPSRDRGAGPESTVLEIRWTPEGSAEVTCVILLPSAWPAFGAAGAAAASAPCEPISVLARCS